MTGSAGLCATAPSGHATAPARRGKKTRHRVDRRSCAELPRAARGPQRSRNVPLSNSTINNYPSSLTTRRAVGVTIAASSFTGALAVRARRLSPRMRFRLFADRGTILAGGSVASSNDMVGAREQLERDVDFERLCGLEIDDEFEATWLQDWQIDVRLVAQNLPDIEARLTVSIRQIGTIAHQTVGIDIVAECIGCG